MNVCECGAVHFCAVLCKLLEPVKRRTLGVKWRKKAYVDRIVYLALVRTRVYECAHLAGFSIKRILRYSAMPSCETLRPGMCSCRARHARLRRKNMIWWRHMHSRMHCEEEAGIQKCTRSKFGHKPQPTLSSSSAGLRWEQSCAACAHGSLTEA